MIEECILLRMNPDACAHALHLYAGISPIVTRVVWSELEKSNPTFFQYYLADLAVTQDSDVCVESVNASDLCQRLARVSLMT